MLHRRSFLQSIGLLSVLPLSKQSLDINNFNTIRHSNRFKISLNAYSFNSLLTKQEFSLERLIDFCVAEGFDAVDLTGYYFPGYPAVPSDDYIFHIKNTLHRKGLSLSGTGIRTDFTNPDPKERQKDIALTKMWIDVAAKLGAPVLRIFSGKQQPTGYDWNTVADWIIKDFAVCVDYAKTKGVIIGLQNHNDFIKTASQSLYFLERLDKNWFGLVLDIGSFNNGDPYPEIEAVIPYAVNWQLKELVLQNGKSVPVDLKKLFAIIHKSNYRGYLPIETLRPDNPFDIVPMFLKKVRGSMGV
jgi:sugar phosphate isomerase/epimerase